MNKGIEQERAVIVFVLPWSLSEPGGVNSVVRNLLHHASIDARVTPLLLEARYSAPGDSWTSWSGQERLPIRVPPLLNIESPLRSVLSFALRRPGAMRRLVQQFGVIRPTAVNVHFPGPWALPLLYALRKAAPAARIVLSFHGADIAQLEAASWYERRMWRVLLSRANAITCCSRALLERLERAAGRLGHASIAFNGVDEAALDAEAAAAPQAPVALAGRRYLVNVGTFEHKKGQDVLLQAFALLRARMPDLHLVLAGRQGPALPHIRSLVRTLGLTRHVTEALDVPHPLALELIRRAEVFVLSSRQEPFGIVLLEAAHFNVPIVATRVGGVPEVLEHGRSALLVPPDEPAAIAAAVEKLIGNPELASSLAAEAKQTVSRRFTGRISFEYYLSLCLAAAPDQKG